MTRARTYLAICALVLPAALIAAACGGDDAESADPGEVVERTFDNDTRITSGVIDFGATVSATGQQGGEFSVALSGPIQAEETDDPQIPQVNLSGSVSGEGGGQSVDESGRLIITEDNLFVEYEDVTYEAGSELFDELRQDFEERGTAISPQPSFRELCEEAIAHLGGDTAFCDSLVNDWLTNLENEGTEDVEGVETVHVSGDLDIEQVLTDVETLPDANLQGVDPSQLSAAVPEASFDIYSGAEDDVLRRFDFRMTIDTSALTFGVAMLPVEEIEIDLSVRFSGINETQTIEPPSGPTEPLEEILGDDFDLEGLGGSGLGGGGLGGLDDLDSGPGDGGGGGAGGEDIDPEDAQRYLDCLEEAAGDPEAINACADEL